MKIIDIESWKRKEHYQLFSSLHSPYFGLTTYLECTPTLVFAKENNCSLFSLYLHKSMRAANSVEELRYRIVEDQVVCYELIHAGSTIAREDETFGFSYMKFDWEYPVFNARLQEQIQQVQNSSGLNIRNEEIGVDLIRHTTIPWHRFTSVLHPTNHDPKESIPRVTFGKIFHENHKAFLPVSIEAHHGLLDGVHLAKYFSEFERLLLHPEV